MTIGRKSSNLVKNHEVICCLIRRYLVPLPSKTTSKLIIEKWGNGCKKNIYEHYILLKGFGYIATSVCDKDFLTYIIQRLLFERILAFHCN